MQNLTLPVDYHVKNALNMDKNKILSSGKENYRHISTGSSVDLFMALEEDMDQFHNLSACPSSIIYKYMTHGPAKGGSMHLLQALY